MRILPRSNYRKIGDINNLRNFHLIHYTDTKDNIDPIDGKVKLESIALRTDHLRDFSNSLLGTFELKHIFLELEKSDLKDYFSDDWNEGESVRQKPIFGKHFTINERRGYFFLKIDECNDHVVPYSDETKIRTICKVLHTPTNSNFWHMSLRWFYGDRDTILMKENERKRILTAAKSFIQEKGSFDKPAYQPVKTVFYK